MCSCFDFTIHKSVYLHSQCHLRTLFHVAHSIFSGNTIYLNMKRWHKDLLSLREFILMLFPSHHSVCMCAHDCASRCHVLYFVCQAKCWRGVKVGKRKMTVRVGERMRTKSGWNNMSKKYELEENESSMRKHTKSFYGKEQTLGKKVRRWNEIRREGRQELKEKWSLFNSQPNIMQIAFMGQVKQKNIKNKVKQQI